MSAVQIFSGTRMPAPTFDDIRAAREFISPHLPRTPLVRVEKLSQLLECDYYAKLENLQPVGAFKVRGGVNLVGRVSGDERRAGLVSASTGNHGQSIAYAGRLFGARVIIYAPTQNVNESKMQAMRDLGADETKLIAGVGTMGLEIFEDLPDVDVIICPAGGGSCASGNSIVAKEINPGVRVIAVQSEGAPAMWHAWKNRRLDPYPTMETQHEGLATRVPFEMTNAILWELLSDFVLVSDAEIDDAIRLLAQEAKQIAEGAGAASLAAAIKLRDQLKGKKVVGILSGGNIPPDRLAALLGRRS